PLRSRGGTHAHARAQALARERRGVRVRTEVGTRIDVSFVFRRVRPELALRRFRQRRREAAHEWWLCRPQGGAVRGSDGVRGYVECAGGGAAGAQDLDVAAAGCRGRAIGSPAQAGIECSGEVGPVPRDPAGQARVGSRDQRGVGRGQGVEDVWQLEAVAGVLDARIGGGGGAGGRGRAAGGGGVPAAGGGNPPRPRGGRRV